ncbi:MAG: UbiD family decarboxylase [Burkholderiaceae bacterium]
MGYKTMRDYLAHLETRGLLRRISAPVDRAWAPAALAKWMYQALPDDKRFGMMFEKVAGSDMPLVTGALGSGTASYAAALGVEPDAINQAWLEACRNPVPPRTVNEAACQEVVHLGRQADLGMLPIPTWTPGKDAGPYITTNVVTRNHDSGVQNHGVYRTLVRDNNSVICNLSPGRQGALNAESWTSKGKPAPIAWVVAASPAVHLATVVNLPVGSDEMNLAGGLMGEPIAMVRCRTVDLQVPAEAEIIIEGEIHPGEVQDEGPFGEFAGYMSGVAPRPVARITAITHRSQPIYYGYTSQMPPSESTVIQSLANAAVLLKMLKYDMGEPTVVDVFIDLTFGGLLAHAVVAMKSRYPGHGKKVGRMLAAISPVKRVTVVDDDVDPRDPMHVEWAMNARFNPSRDTVLIDDVYFPTGIDPSLRSPVSPSTMGSKIVCDATSKVDSGSLSLPPREIMAKAFDLWNELGLPPIEQVPRRARLRIDRS